MQVNSEEMGVLEVVTASIHGIVDRTVLSHADAREKVSIMYLIDPTTRLTPHSSPLPAPL